MHDPTLEVWSSVDFEQSCHSSLSQLESYTYKQLTSSLQESSASVIVLNLSDWKSQYLSLYLVKAPGEVKKSQKLISAVSNYPD